MTIEFEHNLEELDNWIRVRMALLSPAEVRKLFRSLGNDLRRLNTQRMAAQTSPEGVPWTPRKPQDKDKTGKKRKGKMMRKLRNRGHLRQQFLSDGIRIGFFGRDSALARTHQYGLTEQLEFGLAKYPQRQLIGLSEADRIYVRERILQHIQDMTA